MEVHGPGPVSSAFPVPSPRPSEAAEKTTHPKPAAPARAPADELEISEAARGALDEQKQLAEVRALRLAQIKASIDAETYETPEKLEAALEKLLDEIGFDSPPPLTRKFETRS